jgi:hypothetical protein
VNTEYIIITVNTPEVRSAMNNLTGTELVASQATFACWHWINPASGDLATAQGLAGYKSTVQIS